MTERPLIIKGKAFVLTDINGKMINSIDTDMIFHNKYVWITDINEMGQYALDNLEGWKDFAKCIETEKWEILIVGQNFGAGSSRQQAVDCFKSLGIKAIIGESFGAIYKRNAINSGMPLMQLDNFDVASIDTSDELILDLKEGKLDNQTKKNNVPIKPMSQVQTDIYLAGDLFAYGSTID
ncbi:hypothetical protein [Candidatus Borrarchaeum sp.]|uniref:hypothetical protein n=1 Tax=Candidatus Borrarchaeum sp. TaxID=2846742 RepID=UPI00257E2AB2|nr:hypothetical protein [Candidatus Borrarchaeum sp.]